jgi:hypothetical protein
VGRYLFETSPETSPKSENNSPIMMISENYMFGEVNWGDFWGGMKTISPQS